MKKSMNGTALEPFGIVTEEVVKVKKVEQEKVNSDSVVKQSILKEKALLFLLSMSFIWFIAFFYYVLYVFT